MPARQESGLRDHRVEFVREDVDANGDPVTPSDPTWERPSDRVYSVEWGPTPGLTADRGLSDTDVAAHDKGPEEHEFTTAYALQRWFVDANGDPSDLAGDGLLRDADGLLPNTHTVVDRADLVTNVIKDEGILVDGIIQNHTGTAVVKRLPLPNFKGANVQTVEDPIVSPTVPCGKRLPRPG